MECKATIKEVKPVLGGAEITLRLNGDMTPLNNLIGKEIRCKLVQWREKRSKDANAFFYVLVDKLAEALRVSKPYIHNLMLQRYGQIEKVDGKPVWVVLPETEAVKKKVEEEDTLHLRSTSEVKQGKDGKMYRTYLLLKGSHELDTKGMSVLLDGIISECKEVGIQTETPDEIAKMKALWNEQHHTG